MELYKQKYFNHRNWILENISSLNLTVNETVILLLIDFFNEFNEDINIGKLASSANLEQSEVDKTVSLLCSKGYLNIESQQGRIIFNIDAIYSQHNILNDGKDIYGLFEGEFNRMMSRKELETISEWIRIYPHEEIVNALREASINKKLSIGYIDKILGQDKDEQE